MYKRQLLLSLSGICQDLYIPEKSELISESTYQKYTKRLTNAFVDTSVIRYRERAIAYAILRVDSSYVFSNLSKALKTDSTETCEYVYIMDELFNNKSFQKISSSAWEDICILCKDYNKRHKKEELVPLSDLEVKLEEIDKRYCAYRFILMKKQTRNQLDSIDFYWRKQQMNDSINFIALASIFDKYGYPGKSQVQKGYMDVACIVMQHAPIDMKEKYINLIHEAAITGEFHGTTFLHLIDHMHFDKFGTQLYGTQSFKEKNDKGYRSMDMEDPEGFDKRNSDWKNNIFHFGKLKIK